MMVGDDVRSRAEQPGRRERAGEQGDAPGRGEATLPLLRAMLEECRREAAGKSA